MALIKDEIEQGSYRVDPKAVADAILRRLRDSAAASATAPRVPGVSYEAHKLAHRSYRTSQ